jgi:hypothetical protein
LLLNDDTTDREVSTTEAIYLRVEREFKERYCCMRDNRQLKESGLLHKMYQNLRFEGAFKERVALHRC